MTSQINTGTIDTTFPVPGEDNDTQGFRDNFAGIVAGLDTAKQEITDLQVNRATLLGDNNFNLYAIKNAALANVGYAVYPLGTVSGPVALNYVQGNYQTCIVDPTTTTNFFVTNWATAAGFNGVLQLQVQSTGTGGAVSFSTDSTSSTLHVTTGTLNPYILRDTNPVIFEITTPDQGVNQFLSIKNYSAVTTTTNITFGNIHVTNTTSSTTTDTGALVVTGGVGIGGDVNVGGTLSASTGSFMNLTAGEFTVNTSTVRNNVFTSSTVAVSGTVAMDYGIGAYQTFLVDNSTLNDVNFYVDNWPADSDHHVAHIEITFTTSTFVAPSGWAYSADAVTFGTSTSVFLVGSNILQTIKIGQGWRAWVGDVEVGASLTATTITSVVSSAEFTVYPPINLPSGSLLHFQRSGDSPPPVKYTTHAGSIVKYNTQYPSNSVVASTTTSVLFRVSTHDAGRHQLIEHIGVYASV